MIVGLIPHPAHPPGAELSGEAVIERAGDRLSLVWRMTGAVDRLLVPPPAEPVRTDGLWRQTCFEVFLRTGGGPGYFEFNLSPGGPWAAYRFSGRREGMADLEGVAPRGRAHRDGSELTVEVVIDLSDVAALAGAPVWQAAVTVVIEEVDGTKSYWALAHGEGPPDFHDPAGFLLDLRRSNGA